jgi:hypothetical protein
VIEANKRTDQAELSFEEKKQEIVDFLAATENAIMALATSASDRTLVLHVGWFSQVRTNPGQPASGLMQGPGPDRGNR